MERVADLTLENRVFENAETRCGGYRMRYPASRKFEIIQHSKRPL